MPLILILITAAIIAFYIIHLYEIRKIKKKVYVLFTHFYKEFEKFKKPFLPSYFNYAGWDGSEERLRKLANAILGGLELSSDNVSVLYADTERIKDLGGHEIAGLFTHYQGKELILVNKKYTYEPYIIGGILSHEITHLFLSRMSFSLPNNKDNEEYTEIASIYLGLGILIKNIRKEGHIFGRLPYFYYDNEFNKYLKRGGTTKKEIKKFLKEYWY